MPDQEEEPEVRVVGERTGISTGLLVGIAAVLTSILIVGCGAIYWGGVRVSEFATKIDALTLSVNKALAEGQSVKSELLVHMAEDLRQWTEIKGRVLDLEKNGSQATRDLAKDTLRDVGALREEFRIYKAVQDQRDRPDKRP